MFRSSVATNAAHVMLDITLVGVAVTSHNTSSATTANTGNVLVWQ